MFNLKGKIVSMSYRSFKASPKTTFTLRLSLKKFNILHPLDYSEKKKAYNFTLNVKCKEHMNICIITSRGIGCKMSAQVKYGNTRQSSKDKEKGYFHIGSTTILCQNCIASVTSSFSSEVVLKFMLFSEAIFNKSHLVTSCPPKYSSPNKKTILPQTLILLLQAFSCKLRSQCQVQSSPP